MMTNFRTLLQSFYIPLWLHASVTSVKHYSEPVKSIEPNNKDNKNVHLRNFPSKNDYHAPKNTVILCHGLSGFDKIILIPSVYQLTKLIRQSIMTNNSEHLIENGDEPPDRALLQIEYWAGVKEKLEAKGCNVLMTNVPSFGSIEERAMSLHVFLEKESQRMKSQRMRMKNKLHNITDLLYVNQEPVRLNLIAHSMGGLDCRFLISKIPSRNYKISSLTTISTPHHGSEMADYVVNLMLDLEKLALSEPSQIILPPSIHQLTTKYMSFFNATTPNDPTVSYFSYGSCFRPKWFNPFYMTWQIIYNLSGGEPNDGMVTVRSSKWGHFGGCLLDTDHLDTINWRNKLQKDLRKSIIISSDQCFTPGVDMLDFYLYITDDLARRGF